MLSEIGSNFWEYTIKDYENIEMFFWSGKDYNKQYLKSGRNAIKALCKNLIGLIKKVMLPIYTCETVILPFVEEGWEVCFYDLNVNLSINEDSLKQTYDKEKPSVVLVHSYFGFNTIEDESSLNYCKKSGTIIVEDMTQSLFSQHHVECADYYVTSFRKFLAIPDGGALISKRKLRHVVIEPEDNRIDEVALSAFKLKANYFENETEEKKIAFREKYQLLGNMIAQNDAIQEISSVSKSIIFSCDKKNISEKRIRNYNTLFNGIKELNYIKIVLDFSINGCTPLYFPVYIDNRDALQSYLRENQVYCPIIWKKPSQLNFVNGEIRYMYEHMLCIPIDQRYGDEEMNRVIELLISYKSINEIM